MNNSYPFTLLFTSTQEILKKLPLCIFGKHIDLFPCFLNLSTISRLAGRDSFYDRSLSITVGRIFFFFFGTIRSIGALSYYKRLITLSQGQLLRLTWPSLLPDGHQSNLSSNQKEKKVEVSIQAYATSSSRRQCFLSMKSSKVRF